MSSSVMGCELLGGEVFELDVAQGEPAAIHAGGSSHRTAPHRGAGVPAWAVAGG